MNKCDIVLVIFYTLLKEKRLKKEDIMSEYEVSNATFARYIAEIRNFLLEKEPALELTYSRTKKQYFLNDIKRDWFESISYLFNPFCIFYFYKTHNELI